MVADLLKVDKLGDASQWVTWKFQIKIILMSNDLYEHALGTSKKPDAADALRTWVKNNAKVQEIIVNSVSRETVIHLVGCKENFVEESSMLDMSDEMAYSAECLEPTTYEQVIEAKDSLSWIGAMNDEIKSLLENKTWSLVKLPVGRKAIDNRWVYRKKFKTNGDLDRYKARLVVRGFSQKSGVDYQETFSPVVKFSSIRMILAIAAAENLKLLQFDIKTAFLYGNLDEDIYMVQPKGYEENTNRVCKLNRVYMV